MDENAAELAALAQRLRSRREQILKAWRGAVQRDPSVNSGNALPRHLLYDHLPSLLRTFERELDPADHVAEDTAQRYAAAHGLQRWQQGYDLREVTRELSKLNEIVVAELDRFVADHSWVSHAAVAEARRRWAALCSTGIEESVAQFFLLQQEEAAGHVADLERALAQLRTLEQQQADLWHQAAHDLRGNLGVVANATVGLTHTGLQEASRDTFVRILMRNVTSLHHLLDDVTSLSRLQAGREVRHIEPLDISPILQQLCEGVRPLAQQRRLFLRCDGPPGYAADGDAVKIRRIAQNLMLNAVKFTTGGGVTVQWGDSDSGDTQRWMLTITDTGPGLQGSSTPLAHALDNSPGSRPEGEHYMLDHLAAGTSELPPASESAGEGLGLSIVKRLCDMLDASIEVQSEANVGTTFKIRFPRSYPSAS